VVEGSWVEHQRISKGERLRMEDMSWLSTEELEKRSIDCQVDLYDALEEALLRAAVPLGASVPISGDGVGTGFNGTVDILDIPQWSGNVAGTDEVYKTVNLHIEEG
jgi:hypothetical protein